MLAGRAGAPSGRGRSEDQPVRSSAEILTLRAGGRLEDIPPSCPNREPCPLDAPRRGSGARLAAISASLPARSSVLIRASSRRAAVRSAIGTANASFTGRRLAVYLLAFPAGGGRESRGRCSSRVQGPIAAAEHVDPSVGHSSIDTPRKRGCLLAADLTPRNEDGHSSAPVARQVLAPAADRRRERRQ